MMEKPFKVTAEPGAHSSGLHVGLAGYRRAARTLVFQVFLSNNGKSYLPQSVVILGSLPVYLHVWSQGDGQVWTQRGDLAP